MILIGLFSLLLIVAAVFILYWQRSGPATFFAAFLLTLPCYYWLGIVLPGCAEFRSIPFGGCTLRQLPVFLSLACWWLAWYLLLVFLQRRRPTAP